MTDGNNGMNNDANKNANNANDTVDMEGWKAMYEKPFHKEQKVQYRGRTHIEMEQKAQELMTEEPQLPLESVQNALLFKRVTCRKQLLGSLL